MTQALDHGIWLEIGHVHPAENKWIPNMIEDSQKEVLKDAFADLQAEVAQIRAERANILSLYNELIFSVASKFPGETRHQTALKYIRNAEACSAGTAAQAKTNP